MKKYSFNLCSWCKKHPKAHMTPALDLQKKKSLALNTSIGALLVNELWQREEKDFYTALFGLHNAPI